VNDKVLYEIVNLANDEAQDCSKLPSAVLIFLIRVDFSWPLGHFSSPMQIAKSVARLFALMLASHSCKS